MVVLQQALLKIRLLVEQELERPQRAMLHYFVGNYAPRGSGERRRRRNFCCAGHR
jgi:hypothetical protein